MEINKRIAMLCNKDSKETADNFKELLQLSEKESTLYQYFNEFLSMITDEKYLIRLKGFRLLCKQAQWDSENKFDISIDKILDNVTDEKPSAVRQKIQALTDVVIYKKTLCNRIKNSLLLLDYSVYNEGMQKVIAKDIENILELI